MDDDAGMALGVNPRVNGANLSQFVDQNITLVGKVVSQGAGNAVLEASDGAQITVTTMGSFDSSYVEIVGRANADGTVEEFKHCSFGESFSTWRMLACARGVGMRLAAVQLPRASVLLHTCTNDPSLTPPLIPPSCADMDQYNQLVQLTHGKFKDLFV